jgi:DNA-binding NtrC family response regulator
MVRLWRIAAWPLVVKVPVLVAGPDGHRRHYDVAGRALAVCPGPAEQSRADLSLSRRVLQGRLPVLVRRDSRALFDPLDSRARRPICPRRTALCNPREAIRFARSARAYRAPDRIEEAAKRLGVSRSTLFEKMRKLDIRSESDT